MKKLPSIPVPTKPSPRGAAYSNAPSYSCRIWHDAGAIYVELASGLITKFDRTEGALTKVLKLLDRESRNQSSRTIGKSKSKTPIPPKVAKPMPLANPEGTAKATAMLKKRGLL